MDVLITSYKKTKYVLPPLSSSNTVSTGGGIIDLFVITRNQIKCLFCKKRMRLDYRYRSTSFIFKNEFYKK